MFDRPTETRNHWARWKQRYPGGRLVATVGLGDRARFVLSSLNKCKKGLLLAVESLKRRGSSLSPYLEASLPMNEH